VKEAEWLVATEVRHMLSAVRHRLSTRKVRLLACACCRRAWPLLSSERSRRAVALAERFADGLVPHDRLQAAYSDALKAVQERRGAAEAAAATVAALTADVGLGDRGKPWALAAALDELSRWEPRPGRSNLGPGWCAGALRDSLGPLVRRRAFESLWRTPDAVVLARRAYDDRDFAALPFLGDALEEAGCDDGELLEHCRTGGGHGRGCWVVDLVLGKE
jgi:hypothetical protein